MAKKNTNETKNYLEEQANTLLELASSKGIKNNYLFNTTFDRYLMQLELLNQLKEDFGKGNSLVNKEYVKGRENITAHPLITKINQTIDSANKTASLLFKLIANASDIKTQEKKKLDNLALFNLSGEKDELSDIELMAKYGLTREEAEEQLLDYKYFDE